ncbi:MAG: hypothetical protein V7750_12465 [Sneathiella sp.]
MAKYRTLAFVGLVSLCGGIASNLVFADTPVRQVTIDCKLIEATADPLTIGANFDVGSGAELGNRATSQAKSQALGSILGGSSSGGFGSSGSSGGSSLFGSSNSADTGPKTGDDPTIGSFVSGSSDGVNYSLRPNIGPGNKLTVSLDLKDVPGDGTFHSQWLRDFKGNYHLPVKYIIITLYNDWSLTVRWTYDRYVDGEHVEHQEGGWSESGRDNIGSIRLNFSGKEGQENAIWNRLGFGTATKGVRHLVTEYDLPSEVINGACPVRLTNHISLPDKDPVTTVPLLGDIPMLGALFKSEAKRDEHRNLITFITPHIIQDASD